SAATFLEKSENFSAPLLLDLAETSKQEGPLLSQLLRRPGLRVLLASPHLEDQVMTPTFHLEPLSAKQISDFCQAEFKGFAAEHWEEPLRQFSGGNPLRLEYLFQAMREAGWLQWSDQGWNWEAEPGNSLGKLQEDQGSRWAERQRRVSEILALVRFGLSAEALAGLLGLEASTLEPHLQAW